MKGTTTSTTRRTMLTGGMVAVGIAAFPSAAVSPAASADFAIERAWFRRAAAYAAFVSDPEWEDNDKRYWSVIDQQEEIIRAHVAATPRGVLIQLWCALSHSTGAYTLEQDQAVTRGDFDAVEAMGSQMDWSDRLLLAALRSLKEMGAA